MLVDFDKMPSDSKVWIYQASQPFGKDSKKLLTEKLEAFLSQWESHGNPLKASWSLFYDQFVVVTVDETYHAASGCSIDTSVHLIKQLESELGTELLEKSKIAVLEGDQVSTFSLKDLKRSIEEGVIHPDSIIFNNLVPTLDGLESKWKVPAEKTWISKYFNK